MDVEIMVVDDDDDYDNQKMDDDDDHQIRLEDKLIDVDVT